MKQSKHGYVRALVLGALLIGVAGCQQAVKPKPVVHVAPPPPAPVVENSHVSLAADALFGFGKADIGSVNAAGHAQLDELVAKLQAAREVQSVALIGYTDRMGAEAYNQTLSQQRADAVRDYLVAHGVPAGVIQTSGRGEADPVAECPRLKGKKLLDCLAPNRRVEVNLALLVDASAAQSAAAQAPSLIKTVYVSPRKRACSGLGATECYQVRENEQQPWSLWYGDIQGFDYHPGTAYVLQVKESAVTNPPADAPAVRWVLDSVVSQQAKKR